MKYLFALFLALASFGSALAVPHGVEGGHGAAGLQERENPEADGGDETTDLKTAQQFFE